MDMHKYYHYSTLCLALGCATGEPVNEETLTSYDCSDECAAWVRANYVACRDDGFAANDCDMQKEWRVQWCSELSDVDCTAQLRSMLSEPPPSPCEPQEADRSECTGATLVGYCANGRRVELECDDRQCKLGTTALGCRLNDNDTAYCECACEEGAARCDGSDILACVYSEEVTYDCDEVCAADNWGPATGCTETEEGSRCQCEPACTSNYCKGTTLMFCNGNGYEPYECSDATCEQAGFTRFIECGEADDGSTSCLCE